MEVIYSHIYSKILKVEDDTYLQVLKSSIIETVVWYEQDNGFY